MSFIIKEISEIYILEKAFDFMNKLIKFIRKYDALIQLIFRYIKQDNLSDTSY